MKRQPHEATSPEEYIRLTKLSIRAILKKKLKAGGKRGKKCR